MSFNIKTIGNDGIVGNHPDVTSWLNTISLVGGSANSTTIAALNNFCNSIDSAGLRNKFYRLNLFCGNNLASCLVPLYVNTQWNSPVLGFSIDTNNNFVSGDYNETGVNGGLIGNGTNKFLLTGLRGTELSAGNRHLSAYERTSAITDYSPSLGSADGNAIQHAIGPWTASTNYFYRTHNTIGGNANTTKDVGFWLGSDSSSTASVLYRNGVSTTSTSAQSAGGSPSIQYAIFGTVTSSNAISEASEVRLGAYSIGLSLNSSEVSTFNNIMQTFQTALFRNRPSSDPVFASITNTDAKLWIDNVYANRGTVSLSTATAVDTFCNTINSAGIRDRFYRLNLFAGTGLEAAIVPLYRGPSPSGTQFGGSTDTNNNFLIGDYVETGLSRGLKGNQSNKFLNTALTPSALPSFAHHISVYAPFQNATHAFRGLIGASESLNTRQASLYQWITAGQFNYVAGANNSVTLTASVTPPPVFMLGSLNGSASAIFVLDGSVTSGTLGSYSASTQPWFVFGESRAGALANPTDARISAYSIGLPMTSGEAASLRSAFVAMHSAMGGS